MAEIDVKVVGMDEVIGLLGDMPKQLFTKAKQQIAKSTFNTQRSITQPMKSGIKGIQSRTGALARSIQTTVTSNTLDDIRGRVFTKSIYAPIHEIGGIVRAKRAYLGLEGGPFLNIPASANKTASGVMRESARTVFATGGYIIKINAAKAKYAVIKNGSVMFWLVKSVRIKARLNMIKSGEDEIPTLLSNLNDVLLQGL